MLERARRSLVLIPRNNFMSRADFSILRHTDTVWVPQIPTAFRVSELHPQHFWDPATYVLRKSAFTQSPEAFFVGGVLLRHVSGSDSAVCFVLSGGRLFVRAVGVRTLTLSAICYDTLDMFRKLCRRNQRRAVHTFVWACRQRRRAWMHRWKIQYCGVRG